MALPSPLQPVEPKVNMNSVYPGNMIKLPPGFKGAGLGGLLLKLRNNFSPPRFRVNKTLEASTRGLESRDIAQADSDICFMTTPEGDTVQYKKEAWTGVGWINEEAPSFPTGEPVFQVLLGKPAPLEARESGAIRGQPRQPKDQVPQVHKGETSLAEHQLVSSFAVFAPKNVEPA
ncbi:hypothetical protein PM082_014911 [Marasmius tenuissimus]|nr:hypothetical protein PM082_014911 [Marasmius tenuissimus]